MEGRPTGDKDLQTRTGRQEIGNERCCFSEVLKIVEDQQEVVRLQERTDLLRDRVESRLVESECLSQYGWKQGWISKRGQFHKDYPILKTFAKVLHKLKPQSGFADAAGSSEREQTYTIALQEGQGLRHLLLPSDEGCGRKRRRRERTGLRCRLSHLWSYRGEEQGPLLRG